MIDALVEQMPAVDLLSIPPEQLRRLYQVELDLAGPDEIDQLALLVIGQARKLSERRPLASC